MYTVHYGDCLAILPTLPAQSVDAIIADPPYGTTACKWDSVIPLAPMWAELKRVIKPRGAIVLFAAQPFTSALVMSNVEWFKYEIVWDKENRYTGFLDAKRKPLRRHENILCFYREQATYNPQMAQGTPYMARRSGKTAQVYNAFAVQDGENHGTRYPCSILKSKADTKAESLHPTQKPVDLLRYLIRTYTNEGETVLDFTMGSGTTGVAAMLEQRRFIGIELDAGYFDIAKRRIHEATLQQPLFSMAAD